MGGTHGRKAILAGIEGHHFEAVSAALDGRKYIKRLNKYHPDADDAYFGLGLYNYYAAQLPWFGRVLSRLFLGLSGNHERGIAQLERASKHGLFTQVEARLFLAIIYLDTEGRYEEALAVLQELNQYFPENLDFYGMLGYAYRTRRDYANAIHMLEILVDKSVDNPAFGNRSRGVVHYFLGSTYKMAGRFGPAAGQLERAIALSDPETSSWLLASALLERGRVHDLTGDRAAAIESYERVLEVKSFRDSHDKARGFIETPHTAPPEEVQHYLPADGSDDPDRRPVEESGSWNVAVPPAPAAGDSSGGGGAGAGGDGGAISVGNDHVAKP
jgi:tetratricopeptide (TPR) repeat protein